MTSQKLDKLSKNPVYRICKIMQINQKGLSEFLNVSNGTVNRWSSKPFEIPTYILAIFKILEDDFYLKQKVLKFENFIKTFKDLLNIDFDDNLK